MESPETESARTADDHLSQAYALEKASDFDAALAECDAAIKLVWSFLADAHNLRGIILEGLDRNDEAISAYLRALELDPELEEAGDNLRSLETSLGLSDKPVTLVEFGSVAEAHIARGMLASEGIWSYVADEYAATAIGIVDGFTGIRLQVRESDVPQAMEILGMEQEQEEEEEEPQCPRCQSFNVRIPFLGNEWRCKDCGHEWTP